MGNNSWKFVTVSALAMAVSAPVYAQDAAPQANAPQDGATEDQGIGDIVVTAQRRAENVQDVPIAVTALDQSLLDSATIEDLRDLAGRVPSLVVDSVTAGPSSAAISIRGISFEDIEKSFDPAVGVVVDGVFIGTNTGQLLDSFDMERLEVLRGPQGTLFGRNTIGGVINVTRTRPTDDAGIRASAAYSTFDTVRGRVVINSGTLGDIVAIKVFGFYDRTDGFYNNVTKGSREGEYETLTGGVTLEFNPTDTISALLTYEHMRERGETISSPLSSTGKDLFCLAAGAPNFSPAVECDRFGLPDHGLYTTFSPLETPVRNDTDAVTANIDFEFGEFTLSSVTGYRTNDESVAQDFDGSSVGFFNTLRLQQYEQFSQEFRLVGDISDSINLLLGAYYFESNYTLDQTTTLGGLLTGGAPANLRQYVEHSSQSYAGFADIRFELTDALTVNLGGRYTRDKKEIFNNYGRIGALVGLSLPTFDGMSCVDVTGTFSPAPGVVLPTYGAANNCNASQSFGRFTFRGNVAYALSEDANIYGSFSRGFRSGGFNGRASSPTSLGPYQPETVDAFEVGLKADWLDRTLRTNIAFYYTKYDDKQEEIVQASLPGSANPQETVVGNAASANIMGAEFELTARVSEALTFNASFSYTDAEFDNFLNDVVGLTPGSAPDLIPDDVSTLTLRRAPKYTWSFGFNYSTEVGAGVLDLSSALRFQSKYQTCIAPARPRVPGNIVNDERCLTEDREELSAQISYTLPVGSDGQEVSLSLFGRNLTDHRGLSSTLPVAGLFTFASARQPRTVGVEVGFRF